MKSPQLQKVKDIMGGGHWGKTFKIPVYQRNYHWDTPECEQLFDDLLTIVDNRNLCHFIGVVCDKDDKDDSDVLVIIDGQQRITTITILLKVLYDLLDQNNPEEGKLARDIKEGYLVDEYKTDNAERLRLKPVEKDAVVFKKMMDLTVPFCNQDLTADEKNTHIYKNYMTLRNRILSTHSDGISYGELFAAVERLQMVELRLDDENAQIIFETLNARGKPLTATDLIRNYLLMSLTYEEQTKHYSKYWLPTENRLDKLASDAMLDFLYFYLIMTRRSNNYPNPITGKSGKINRDRDVLYPAFKKYFPTFFPMDTEEHREHCFKELERYSRYYAECVFPNNTIYEGLSPIKKRLFALFSMMKQKSASIIVMYLYDKLNDKVINEEQLCKILDIMCSYELRTQICGSGRRGLNEQTSAYLLPRINPTKKGDEFVTEFWRAITSFQGTNAFPDDATFRNALLVGDLFHSKNSICHYVLYSLEINEKHSKEIPPMQSGTIEHIYPQDPEKWTKYIEEYDDTEEIGKYLHNIGNLTLTGYNSEISNNPFSNKQEEYKLSNYSLTRDLANYEKWTSQEITKRARILAGKCCKIWPLPERWAKDNQVKPGIEYTLRNESKMFSSTQPCKLKFGGDEYDVNTWIDLAIVLLEELRTLDEQPFIHLTSAYEMANGSPISRQKGSAYGAKEIGKSGYYYVGGRSTVDIINNLNRIVSLYQEMTDWEDIWEEITFEIASEKTSHNQGTYAETEQARYEYWTAFNDYCENHGLFSNGTKAYKASTDHWHLVYHVSKNTDIYVKRIQIRQSVQVSFDIFDNKNFYDHLFTHKEEIESSAGIKFVWLRLDDKKVSRIQIEKEFPLEKQENWPEQFKWAMSVTQKLMAATKPFI